MSASGTPSNTSVNNRVTKEPWKGLKMLLWNSYTAIQSIKRQFQAKNQQLHERNEYILQQNEQLKRTEAAANNSNEQHEHIEVVNVDDKNCSQTSSSSTSTASTSSSHPQHQEEPIFPKSQPHNSQSLMVEDKQRNGHLWLLSPLPISLQWEPSICYIFTLQGFPYNGSHSWIP